MQLTLVISNIMLLIVVHICLYLLCSLVCRIFCYILSCIPHAPRGNQHKLTRLACDLLNKVAPIITFFYLFLSLGIKNSFKLLEESF